MCTYFIRRQPLESRCAQECQSSRILNLKGSTDRKKIYMKRFTDIFVSTNKNVLADGRTVLKL